MKLNKNLIERPELIEFNVPLLIICYNRSQYINSQVKQLKKIKPKRIFIACDGAKDNPTDIDKVAKVRESYLNAINWECDIKTRFSDVNQGCFQGVKNALNWFFEINKEGIIMEDDIIPTTDFFYFTKAMLNYYRDDTNIFNISGCNLGYTIEASVFGSKIMNMWGWATWSDRFFEVDFSIKSWQSIKSKKIFLYKKLRNHFFDYDEKWIDHWNQIFDNAVENEEFSTWDYQFIYNQIESGKLTIYPGKNLIKNLGFDEDATHTTDKNHLAIRLDTEELNWPLRVPRIIKADKIFNEKYIKERWAYYKRRNWKFYVGSLLKKITF